MNLTINEIAVQFEPSIIQHKINPTASRSLEGLHRVPQLRKVAPNDILLRRRKVGTPGGLETFDLLLGHVDKQRKDCRVAPETDWHMWSVARMKISSENLETDSA